MPRLHITRRHNPETGRSADVFLDPTEMEFIVKKRNGDLWMGEETFNTDDDGLAPDGDARRDAIDEANDFVNGHVTNIEMLIQLSKHSRSGALIEGFVVQALSEYADSVLRASEIKSEFVNPEAWRQCAKEVRAAIDKHME